jgi:hypothetical protein
MKAIAPTKESTPCPICMTHPDGKGFSLSSTSPAQGMLMTFGVMTSGLLEIEAECDEGSHRLFIVNLQLFILCEFFRRYFDKRISSFAIPRTWKTKTKTLIRLESTLLGETWKTIEMLYSRSTIIPGNHPAETFRGIYEEGELVILSVHAPTETSTTARLLTREEQSRNRVLQKIGTECQGDIPFDRQTSHATWSFLQQCLKMASINDDFRSQYLKMIKARMELTTHVRENCPVIFSDVQKVEMRGKKRIKKMS